MKRMVIFAFLAVVGLTIVGCSDNNADYDKYYDKYIVAYAQQRNIINQARINESIRFYETPHQLRKMFVKKEETTVKVPGKSEFSGGFFLFIGRARGQRTEGVETKYVVTYVRFAWEIKDNTYITTTIPLEKVRIKLAGRIVVPTVSFFLDESVRANPGILDDHYEPQEALSKYLKYAVFTVRSQDWPQNINLPSGEEG